MVEANEAAGKVSAKVIANTVTTAAAVAISADADNVAAVVAEAEGEARAVDSSSSNSAVSHARHSHQSSPTAKPSAGSIRSAKVDSFAALDSAISPSPAMRTCRCS